MEFREAPRGERGRLDFILEESFEGLYLRHSRRMLQEVSTVRAATSSGVPVGLIMLKDLGRNAGYVYYVAVAKSHRGKGVAALLLKDALGLFQARGALDVFASVEEDNAPSNSLFAAEGFARTSLGEVAREYGVLHGINMYREMMVVPGERLLRKRLPLVPLP